MVRKYLGFILIVVLGFVPLIPLLHAGLPITHDGQDHVARIANFYTSLSEGIVIPRWAGNLNWGYGHPILMFLYPLSSYSASLFHFLGFSFVDSLKIVFGLTFILSGIFMYMWVREFLGEEAGVVSGFLYMFAPYRFVDLYVRGAIGEHVAFIFPPLIAYFLLKISTSKKPNGVYFAGASMSLAGLILAHNAISLMFLPFIIFYGVYLLFLSKRRSVILEYAAVLFLGFALSAFFWVPAFMEGKYTLRDIVTEGITLSRFVNLNSLLYGPWNYGQTGQFSLQVGILSWLAVIVSPVLLVRKLKAEKKTRALYLLALIYFAGSLFIMLPISAPLWKAIGTLQKFQFPWRFLSVSVFAAALIGAIVASVFKKSARLLMFGTIVLSLVLTHTYWIPKGYLVRPESFYSGIYNGTTDTGESAPIWSVRFMERRPKARAEIIDGTAQIKYILRNSIHHAYEVDAKDRIRVKENTLYFPGWKVYVDGKEYQDIQFQDPVNRGLMTFFVSPGNHRIDVVFTDTKIRKISNYISLISLFVMLAFSGVFIRKYAKDTK